MSTYLQYIYNIYISTLCQVGPPLPCNNVKLVDIPDMEYWASRGQGEVCVMGANVFQGYFRSVSIVMELADKQKIDCFKFLGIHRTEWKKMCLEVADFCVAFAKTRYV